MPSRTGNTVKKLKIKITTFKNIYKKNKAIMNTRLRIFWSKNRLNLKLVVRNMAIYYWTWIKKFITCSWKAIPFLPANLHWWILNIIKKRGLVIVCVEEKRHFLLSLKFKLIYSNLGTYSSTQIPIYIY